MDAEIAEYFISQDRRYSKDHLWYQEMDFGLVIGISDYLISRIGDIRRIALPDTGEEIDKKIKIYAGEEILVFPIPSGGKIVELNHEVINNSELLVNSPYLKGWIIILDPYDVDIENLLTPEQYIDAISKNLEFTSWLEKARSNPKQYSDAWVRKRMRRRPERRKVKTIVSQDVKQRNYYHKSDVKIFIIVFFLFIVLPFVIIGYVSENAKSGDIEASWLVFGSFGLILVGFVILGAIAEHYDTRNPDIRSYKNATCWICGEKFNGTSEIGHVAKKASNVAIRTSLFTLVAGPMGTMFGLFGGSDPPYRPKCPKCCGICYERRSECECETTYKSCSTCGKIISHGLWVVNSGDCSSCNASHYGDDL